jgi:hypothetical protein
MSNPVFVVVGNVNQGKSSIVATLAADPTVARGPQIGITRICCEFHCRVNDRTLYTLVDTPGFERPRQALHWMKQRVSGAVDKRHAVEDFVSHFDGSDEYQQEVRLLKPILDGGAILYVVDGSKPFSPKYEVEMEILQWTAQPRMALINPINSENVDGKWHQVLMQYFGNVRVFNAIDANFADRLNLLEGLREVNAPWRNHVDKALKALRQDRVRCLGEAASIIAGMLTDTLSLRKQCSISKNAEVASKKQVLQQQFFDAIRAREQVARDEIKKVYAHERVHLDAGTLAALEKDLVAVSSSSRLGLSKRKLELTGAAAGAMAGALVDVGSGGSTMGAGTVIGGLAGGAAAYSARYLGKRVLDMVPRVLKSPGGPSLRIGPITDISFAWLLLDRAMLTFIVVSGRAHACLDKAVAAYSEEKGVVEAWPTARRAAFERHFQSLRSGRRAFFRELDLEAVKRDLKDLLVVALGEYDAHETAEPDLADTEERH